MSEKAFSKIVLGLLDRLPSGRVTTYGELARAAGKPGASRAAGNVLNKNPSPVVVPCHRVVSSDGSVGGYAFGVEMKVELLEGEGVHVENGRVVGFQEKFFSF